MDVEKAMSFDFSLLLLYILVLVVTDCRFLLSMSDIVHYSSSHSIPCIVSISVNLCFVTLACFVLCSAMLTYFPTAIPQIPLGKVHFMKIS